MEAMISFVDAYRDKHGVEPICRVLAIAPSTYHAAKKRPPSARALRDAELRPEILRIADPTRNLGAWGAAALAAELIEE